MVFSDTSGKTGIVEDIDFLCGTSAVSYPLADKARNANRHYYKALIHILRASGRFQFDDSNLTTLPVLTFDLVAGQQDYNWPTGALKIEALEIKDNGGNWHRLKEIDSADLQTTITDFQNTNGVPLFYDTRGDSILLYPAPATGSVTITAGGKIYVVRELDVFTAADTTQEPGFAEPFHRILSLGAAHDFLLVNGPDDKMDRVMQEYTALFAEMREFYSDRNRDTKVRIRPATSTRDYI